MIYSEEAIIDENLSSVDVSALILSAHVLFKRKEFGKLNFYSNIFIQITVHDITWYENLSVVKLKLCLITKCVSQMEGKIADPIFYVSDFN